LYQKGVFEMNAIGLNIIVKANTPLPLLLTEQEAQLILERFLAQKYDEGETVGGYTVDGVRWGVKWDSICAVHTFNPQQAATRQNTGRSPYNRSGN